MFCSKCGKEIMDEAVVCPNCGCATQNYTAQLHSNSTDTAPAKEYLVIKQFVEQAKTIQTLGIIAAVLMFGIGIIFSIIIWVKTNAITVPEATTDANEIAELETAKKRLKTGNSLSFLPVIALVLCITIGLLSAAFS